LNKPSSSSSSSTSSSSNRDMELCSDYPVSLIGIRSWALIVSEHQTMKTIIYEHHHH